MKEILLSLVVGGVTGAAFALLRLPVPAPATLAGLMGIVGLFIGYVIVQYLQ